MAVTVRVYPAFWRLARTVAITSVAVLCVWAITRGSPQENRAPHSLAETDPRLAAIDLDLLLPKLQLPISMQAHEAEWIQALAGALDGRSEVPLEGGRADEISHGFAVEVDRLEKWHESIGQALHYSDASGLRPAVALILDHDWSSREELRRKVAQADQIAAKQGINVLLLVAKP